MKLLTLLALFCLSLALAGCPKKKSEDAEVSGEPVEGSSSAASEKATESGGGDEMQEKKGGNSDAASAPDTSPAEEKK